MLRKRSRAVTSKQSLMAADHSCSQSSPTHTYKNPIPYFLVSPRFKAFTTKCLAESTHEVVNSSPTSTLDTKQLLSSFVNPFCWYELNPPTKSPKILSESKQYFSRDQKLADSKGIGLALVDILTHNVEEKSKPSSSSSSSSSSNSSNKMVIFGTNLRVQIPPLPPSNISPADFGIKTKNNSQLSPTGSANSSTHTKDSSRVVTACLSATEMELSEDYTCVISHGPKPKTTHIFDNCIIESYYSLSDKLMINSPPENFLSFCYTCKKNLEQKNDIYIYRGEKAFCSQECRYQEMLVDGLEN